MEAASQTDRAWQELSLFLDDALREYVAAGGTQDILSVPGAVSVVTREQMDARGAMNITEAMRGLPGGDVTMVTASQPLVGLRGSNPFDSQRLAVLVDGRPIEMDFFGVKTFTQLPVSMREISEIQLLRNPAALYGANAIAGAINIVTRRPTATELDAKLSAGENQFRYASATAAGLLDRGFYRLSFETQRTHQFADRQVIVGEGPELKDAGEDGAKRANLLVDQHYTASAKVSKRVGSHNFEGTASLMTFDGMLRFPDKICEQEVALRNVSASAAHELTLGGDVLTGRHYSLRTQLTFNQGKSDLVGAREIAKAGVLPGSTTPLQGASPHRLSRDTWMLNSQFSGPMFEAVEGQLVSGVEVQYTATGDVRMLSQPFQRATGGLYALPSISPVRNLRLFAGGRADLGFHQKLLLSPTASAVYRINENSSVRASAYSAARAPNVYELGLDLVFIEDSSKSKRGYYFGNPELTDERLNQVEFGYLWDSQLLRAGANVFAARLERQIEMVEVTDERVAARGFDERVTAALGPGYDRSLSFLEYHNQANVSTLGAEIFGEVRPITGLALQGSYTRLNSQAEVITDEATSKRRESAAHRNAPRNKFSVGGRYTLGGTALKGLAVSVYYDWSDVTAAYVSGALKTIPSWSVLTARVAMPLPRDIGEVSLDGFNVLDHSHFEWPRHQVGRRVLASVALKL